MGDAGPVYLRKLDYSLPLPINFAERTQIKNRQDARIHQISSYLLCNVEGTVVVDYDLMVAPSAPSDDSECKLEWQRGPLRPPANFFWTQA